MISNGNIEYTADSCNWSFSKEEDETLRQFIERSCQATIDFLTKYGEERIFYFWKIPICKQKIKKQELDEVPLFDIVIPGDQEFFGCFFY